MWGEEYIEAGTVYLDLRQASSPLAATILEPWSQDGWYADDTDWMEGTYPIMRVRAPIDTGTRAVPRPVGDGILGGP